MVVSTGLGAVCPSPQRLVSRIEQLHKPVVAAVVLSLTPASLLAGAPALGWSDLHDGGANLVDDGFVALGCGINSKKRLTCVVGLSRKIDSSVFRVN